MAGRVLARTISALFASALVVAAASGCDDFRDVAVTNGCEFSIEVSNSHVNAGYGVDIVKPGDTVTAHSSGGPFDIVARALGSDDWDVIIHWDDMDTSDDRYSRSVTLEGDNCPDSQA